MDENKSSFSTKPPSMTSFAPTGSQSGGHKSLFISLALIIVIGAVGYFLYSKGIFNRTSVIDSETPKNELTTLNPASATPGFPTDFPFGKQIKVLQNYTFTTDSSIQYTRQYTTDQSPQVIHRGVKDFLSKRNWAVDEVLKKGEMDNFYSFEATNNLERLSVTFNKVENTEEWMVDMSLSSVKVLKSEPIPDPVKN